MKEQDNETTQPQLNTLQEFEIYKTPILAGIVHMDETIALKRVCENLGLDWPGQHQRIKRNDQLSQLCVQAKQVAPDGKKYDMLCLPPLAFQDWLYSLNEVQSDNLNRELLQTYQKGLVIQLMIMLKMSMDEIERLKGIETNFLVLAQDVKELIKEDNLGKEASKAAKGHFKSATDIKKKIIDDLESNLNQLRIGF